MVRNSYAQQSGQGQYAAGDKVTVYSGEREGYMVDFWSASPQDKVTFTYEGAGLRGVRHARQSGRRDADLDQDR